MSGPVVTALMPVKDYHERFVREAVGSMLAQTCPDWRLLVIVEKAGRTELQRVLGEPLADPRIEMLLGSGRRLGGALNAGMRHAETEFVAILLGDDVWSPDSVEVLARNIAASPEVDFFHSARRVVDADGRPLSSIMPSRPNVSLEDFGGSSPVKHLLCWRRERGLAIGGMDETLNSVGVDDYDFPWSMAEAGASFKAIPECLYVYRDHREHFRLTTHLPLNHHKREIARILRKHGIDDATIAARVADAERDFLRQCLYRSRIDRWIKERRGFDARTGWRLGYR
jgi:glycosyltransferase involved in cell wall biosynthesis